MCNLKSCSEDVQNCSHFLKYVGGNHESLLFWYYGVIRLKSQTAEFPEVRMKTCVSKFIENRLDRKWFQLFLKQFLHKYHRINSWLCCKCIFQHSYVQDSMKCRKNFQEEGLSWRKPSWKKDFRITSIFRRTSWFSLGKKISLFLFYWYRKKFWNYRENDQTENTISLSAFEIKLKRVEIRHGRC